MGLAVTFITYLTTPVVAVLDILRRYRSPYRLDCRIATAVPSAVETESMTRHPVVPDKVFTSSKYIFTVCVPLNLVVGHDAMKM